jgi:hypothetical protein
MALGRKTEGRKKGTPNSCDPTLVPDHKLMDGINAARLTMGKCWFDKTKCADGIEAPRQYRADFDAFRHMAMAYKELEAEPPLECSTTRRGCAKGFELIAFSAY